MDSDGNDTVTVLVNLSETEATYDSTIVADSKLIISNYGDTEPGKMRADGNARCGPLSWEVRSEGLGRAREDEVRR